MSNKLFLQVAALLLIPAITVLGYTYMSRTPAAGPVPVVVVEKPIVSSLSDFYLCLAELVRRDSAGLIGTTGAFRDAHITAAKLLVNGTSYERVAGRDVEISDTIVAAIGLEDQVMTASLRGKLAVALEEIGGRL